MSWTPRTSDAGRPQPQRPVVEPLRVMTGHRGPTNDVDRGGWRIPRDLGNDLKEDLSYFTGTEQARHQRSTKLSAAMKTPRRASAGGVAARAVSCKAGTSSTSHVFNSVREPSDSQRGSGSPSG